MLNLVFFFFNNASASQINISLHNETSKAFQFESSIDESSVDRIQTPLGKNLSPNFTKKIKISNIGSKPLIGFFPTFNHNNFRTIENIRKSINLYNQPGDLYRLFNFFHDNIWHATNHLFENYNPCYLFNVTGYGLCSENSNVLKEILSNKNSRSRLLSLHGHVVREFYTDSHWCIIDGDRNAIYLNWDNKTLASEAQIIEDPLIGIRTKIDGKHTPYKFGWSWANTSLFEFASYHQHKIDFKNIKNKRNFSQFLFDLYKGEFLIFHYNISPELSIGKGRTAHKKDIDKQLLCSIEQKIIIDKRIKNNKLTIRSAWPFYKITNTLSSEIEILNTGNILLPGESARMINQSNFTLTLETKSSTGNITTFSQASRLSLPKITSGSNHIDLGVQSNPTKLEFSINLNTKIHKNISSAAIKLDSKHYVHSPPSFKIINNEKVPDLIWLKISPDSTFLFLPPGLNHIIPFTSSYKLSKIECSFLNPNQKYFVKIRPQKNGVWGKWSKAKSFYVTKPEQVKNITLRPSLPHNLILSWNKNNDKDIMYHVFGSNSKDFIPDLYTPIKIREIKNHYNVISADTVTNRIISTKHNSVLLNKKFSYYRIIAQKDSSYSVPSSLISTYSNMRLFDTLYVKVNDFKKLHLSSLFSDSANILQTRWQKIPDKKKAAGYYDLSIAKRKTLYPPISSFDNPVFVSKEGLDGEIKDTTLFLHAQEEGVYSVALLCNKNLSDNIIIRWLRKVKWIFLMGRPFAYYKKYYQTYVFYVKVF